MNYQLCDDGYRRRRHEFRDLKDTHQNLIINYIDVSERFHLFSLHLLFYLSCVSVFSSIRRSYFFSSPFVCFSIRQISANMSVYLARLHSLAVCAVVCAQQYSVHCVRTNSSRQSKEENKTHILVNFPSDRKRLQTEHT